MSTEMVLITIGGVAITVLLSIVSFFLVRLVNQLDSLDDKLEDLEKQLALYSQTVNYLQDQLNKLQSKYEELLHKYNVLERGVEAFDNWINKRQINP